MFDLFGTNFVTGNPLFCRHTFNFADPRIVKDGIGNQDGLNCILAHQSVVNHVSAFESDSLFHLPYFTQWLS